MLELILTAYARNLGLLRKLTADLDDAVLAEQPAPGMNHPAWIIGHLAWASDLGLQLMGRPGDLPADWPARFGMGSIPQADRAAYPEKSALLERLEAAHRGFAAGLPEVGPAALAAPLPEERIRTFLPTVGDALIHLATSHEGLHIGQLSAWRRARGLAAVPLF